MPSQAAANSGALFRLLVVCVLFSLNFLSLVGVLFRAKAKLCAHSFAYGLSCILLNIYLSSWIPYFFSSYYHATVWPLLEVHTHCAIQHLVTVQISTMLLAVLCLQKMFETFASKRAKLLCAIIFFTWIFPQSLYSVISEMISSSENDNLYFMDGGSERGPEQHPPPFELSPLNQGVRKAAIGVLFCLHPLNYYVISNMTWHYVVLVVPLTSIFIICAGSKQFAKNSLFGTLPNVNCQCSGDIVITVCQCSNFIWLLFARPLLSLVALLRSDLEALDAAEWKTASTSAAATASIESIPLDLGSHLILFLISALLPFSGRFGLFSCAFSSDSDIESNGGSSHKANSARRQAY